MLHVTRQGAPQVLLQNFNDAGCALPGVLDRRPWRRPAIARRLKGKLTSQFDCITSANESGDLVDATELRGEGGEPVDRYVGRRHRR